MRSAEEVFSAAREIAKAQLPDGTYVPTSQLTPEQRRAQRAAMSYGGAAGNGGETTRRVQAFARLGGGTVEPRTAESKRNTVGARTGYTDFRRQQSGFENQRRRGVSDVYRNWGIEPGIEDALKEKTRPSSKYKGVEFGSSISPEMATKIEAQLDPKVVAGAKGGLVFHRGTTTHGAVAAAGGAHQTTGGKGRIIFNDTVINADGSIRPGQGAGKFTFRQVLNHEAVHAQVKGKNPFRLYTKDGTLSQTRALGEEARADAKSTPGPGLYRRTGNVKGKFQATWMKEVARGMPDQQEALKGHLHYNDVHRKLRSKLGQPTGLGGYVADLPQRAKLTAQRPAVVAAALAGGLIAADAYDTRKKVAAAQRDGDGDGRINDGTPQERTVAKSYLDIRDERDERVRDVSAAGLGLSAGATAGVASRQHRNLGRDGELLDWSNKDPEYRKGFYERREAAEARSRKFRNRSALHGRITRTGMIASAAGLATGAGLGVHDRKRDAEGKFAKNAFTVHGSPTRGR